MKCACTVWQVLNDPSVDKAGRKARAKALKSLGQIFRNCKRKSQGASAEAVSHKDLKDLLENAAQLVMEKRMAEDDARGTTT